MKLMKMKELGLSYRGRSLLYAGNTFYYAVGKHNSRESAERAFLSRNRGLLTRQGKRYWIVLPLSSEGQRIIARKLREI